MNDPRPSREADAFIVAVEDLLERRRQEVKKQNPKRRYREERGVANAPYRFTLEELYIYFPWFRELRKQRKQGKYRRPPRREDVIELRGAYQCDLNELNILLNAAGYAREVPYLEGEELTRALNHAERIIRYLPLPGYIITRDFNIHRWNDEITRLFGISHDELNAMPTHERNILRFIFDSNTPVYKVLAGSTQWWEYTARLNVYRFKQENLLCQYDDWYIATYEYLKQFRGFEEFWKDAQPGIGAKTFHSPQGYPAYETEIFTPANELVRIQGLSVFDATSHEYPQAVLYIPADEYSTEIFTKYGFATPLNGWGYKPS